MNNLLTAIATKISGSALSTDVGGRIYLDNYPPDEMPPTFPYVIYFIVAGTPEKTFTEHYTNTVMQFSLFSTSAGASEISNMYADLKSLFDECSFAITGSTLVWMREQNLTPMTDDITTVNGTGIAKHWAVDFEIRTSKN